MIKHLPFSYIPVMLVSLVILGSASSCKKSSSAPQVSIIQDTIVVQSIIGPPPEDLDPSRPGFIDLYDGVAYDQSDAALHSSDIDFAYNYHGGGCSTCRFFENVTDMSTRTGYVSQFSTITNSMVGNVAYYDSVSISDFQSIKTATDISNLFTKKVSSNDIGSLADITNRVTDVATGKVFGFIDKNGRKGFFMISDYVANVPDGDPAVLTLYVKVEK